MHINRSAAMREMTASGAVKPLEYERFYYTRTQTIRRSVVGTHTQKMPLKHSIWYIFTNI